LDRVLTIDEMLNEAFLLSYFIHGHKETALRIVLGAMSKLDVATTAQSKRRYYKPAGRSLLRSSNGFRSKITFSELHLLQRLIYIESEPYEKQREAGTSIRKEDLVIHFIKHLVRVTLKRNSFYVTLGISRLLYNYTTTETMGIYNVVIQDPERVKDDYYYRSRKGVLMQEIKARFGDLVRISHGQRGEDRFQAESEPSRFVDLVNECLSFFTPWATPCLVPASVDPILDTIPALKFEGREKEDQVEINRIHAALHPKCYQRLIKALGFHSPDQRLAVPHFFLSADNNDRNNDRRDRRPNLELARDDLNTIKQNLNDLAERRRKASTGLLRILVDGVDYKPLDLNRGRRVRLDLDREPELIEIWTSDETGELLLASHLVTYNQPEFAQPLPASVRLDGGQEISIVVSPSPDGSAVIDVGYHEKKSWAAGPGLFAKHPFTFRGWSNSNFLIPALSFLFLIILTGVAVRYIRTGADSSLTPEVANKNDPHSSAATHGNATNTQAGDSSPTAAANEAQKQSEPAGDQTPSEKSQPLAQKHTGESARATASTPHAEPAGTSVESPTSTSEQTPAEREVTRGSTATDVGVPLLQVKRVYVESGSDPSSQILRQMLVKQLQRSDKFTLTETRVEADALFKVTTSARSSPGNRSQTERVFFVVLVNARGEVVWPVKDTGSRGKYSGLTPEQVSAQVVKDLLEDIEHLRRQN
jgi:hypothetical protein